MCLGIVNDWCWDGVAGLNKSLTLSLERKCPGDHAQRATTRYCVNRA